MQSKKELMNLAYQMLGLNPAWVKKEPAANDMECLLVCTKNSIAGSPAYVEGEFVTGIGAYDSNIFDLVCTRTEYEAYAKKQIRLLREEPKSRKHAHYFKDVSELDEADVYMVCHIFEVADHSGCKHHSIKKLLLSGGRGVKNEYKDVSEARDTLNRWLEINKDLKEE